MATDWPRFGGVPGDVVKGGVGISGLYDLEAIRLSYLNATLGLTPETARRASPVHLAPGAGAGPLLLPVGGLEGPEYHRQTADLATAWRRRGRAVEPMDMSGLDHFSIVDQLLRPDTPLARAIHRQMGLAA
jgi:arylformamidase